jgi:heat shock protein HtpX
MPPPDSEMLERHRVRNRMQTGLILAGLTGWMALVGWIVAGLGGVVLASAGVLILLALPQARSMAVLRALMGALPLAPWQAPGLVRLVGELADRAGLDRAPTLLVIPRAAPIALSAGREGDQALALSQGLVEILPPRELAGVLAHEISHLRQGDLGILRLADAARRLTRALSLFALLSLALWLPLAVAEGGDGAPFLPLALLALAPLVGDLLTLGLSRTREFAADAGAVALTGDPLGLIMALERIERSHGGDWERMARGLPGLGWVRTHPPTAARIARLRELAPVASPVWVPFTPGMVRIGPLPRPRRWWWPPDSGMP